MPGPTPLSLFGAEIVPHVGGYPEDVAMLVFACPRNHSGHHHQHGIPFRDGPARYEQVGGRKTPIWHREAGSTPDDLTLSPSYDNPCLHAFVRAGKLEIL